MSRPWFMPPGEEQGSEPDHAAAEAEPEPRPAQEAIITSETYPMRVLAGAGTGKTFTMVRKIERLLEQGVDPQRILALTFTNKAAASMRDKLIEKVGEPGYDIDAYTYHAVCHELLQEFAYHADLDPGYEIATDADQYLVVRSVLDDIPYRFIKPEVYSPSGWGSGVVESLLQFIPALKRGGYGPDDLGAYLPTQDRLADLEGVVERIEAQAASELAIGWRKVTDERVKQHCEALTAYQEWLKSEAAALGETSMEADIGVYLQRCSTLLAELAAWIQADRARIIEEDDAPALKLPALLLGGFGSVSDAPDLEFKLSERLLEFIETCQMASDLLPGYRAYERQLRAENLLDFNDLVNRAVDLLEDETICEWITGQYDYVFCDEFQDTDTVQFELVQQLAADSSLFVVGDDDQAIYEWRGANVENIGPRLSEALPSLVDQELVENFRSRQPILDLANSALEQLEGRGSEKTLSAVGDRAAADTGVVTVEAADDGPEQAAQVTNAITRLLTARTDLTDEPYQPGDIAILVRQNAQAQPIMEALADAGIPYELSGDLAAESPGLKTVVAYLRALANPDDEVSLNRVLQLRYRLCAADLACLNESGGRDGRLIETLQDADPTAFDEPARVARAQSDLTQLLELRDTMPLAGLYQRLKEITDISLYLTEQERRDLTTLEEVISNFGGAVVQQRLSQEFIEYLGLQGSLTGDSGGEPGAQSEGEQAAVSIMTVHKSKGLEFPVVIQPDLTQPSWRPRERRMASLTSAIEGVCPLATSPVTRDEREQRRVLHVGITRAEELLLLFGSSEGECAGEVQDAHRLATPLMDALCEADLPLAITGATFSIWETIAQASPSSVVNATETLATQPAAGSGACAEIGGEPLTRSAAAERLLTLVDECLEGQLAAGELASVGIDPEAVATADSPALQRRHSYTSIDTLTTCERKHYLDHVVRAFPDPVSTSSVEGRAGASPREIGVLFHDTAEQAAKRGIRDRARWVATAERIAAARGLERALPAARGCIDRFFETEAAGWEIVAAERAFELELGGYTITGMIDAVARTSTGELVVLDYKASARTRSLETNLQLPIYLLACEQILDEPPARAGYVYVGEVGPSVALREFSPRELRAKQDEIEQLLARAADSSYEEYSSGDHCRYCSHRSLSCSPEGEGL